jgi:cbb3-type cytochrome oxidase maturation protein
MDVLLYLIPIALFMGLIGLAAFLWSLKSGQYDDLDGAAHRILFDDDGVSDTAPPPETDGAGKDGDAPAPEDRTAERR